MITIENLEKSYGDRKALKGVSLSIHSGEFFGLLGPNGAGKSTLMHILSGIVTADAGTLTWERGGAGDSGTRNLLGLAPQEIALYLDLTAWANIEIFGGIYGLNRREIQQQGKRLLEMVNLADRANDKVKSFSGGMKRRLNLIVSLLHKPLCLLCDEPTVGVDPQSRNAIFEFLESLNAEGLTIIYTTHYMEEVERLCTRIGIIDDGVVKAVGTRAELLAGEADKVGEVRLHECAELDTARSALNGMGEWIDANGFARFIPSKGVSILSLSQVLEGCSFPAAYLELRRPSLEQRFLELTGKELRE